MEQQMLEMRQELTALRSLVQGGSAAPPSIPPVTGPTSQVPPVPSQTPQLHSPVSPVGQAFTPTVQPTFIQGSSTQPIQIWQPNNSAPDAGAPQAHHALLEPPLMSLTPSPSPHLAAAQASEAPSSRRRKRRTPKPPVDEDEASSSASESSVSSDSRRPFKRVSHHDKRILTIHHAMRLHFIRAMAIESDKHLPEGYAETRPLAPEEPVRFHWDKTTKQSVHNARMKSRVIEDLKESRHLYKHVPDKEFSKKVLDSVFEQCFTTLRQKYKTQRDTAAAENLKKREDAKAYRSRRIARRKAKLSTRADTRVTIKAFDHVVFDGAFHIDCMSSEESEFEGNDQSDVFRTRGYAWRSTRLNQFYITLDEKDRHIQASKPKRGHNKKDRVPGPLKEDFQLPPKGVSTWMVSKRWISEAQQVHEDLLDALKRRIIDPAEVDESRFEMLGDDSELEEPEPEPVPVPAPHLGLPPMSQPPHPQQMMHPYAAMPDMGGHAHVPHPYYTSGTSSLSYAFV
ncbi:hypothetical protein HGRIS_009453 [Hohenbuehelia grisea]|uniref:Uncharacterized protein n=1 Tax=Hohenbuehelia grisea TaxID=104357 RepID=A0ABR3J1D4_9AGAR